MTLVDFSAAPENPIERIIWLDGVLQRARK
jgi:hypothetical protein